MDELPPAPPRLVRKSAYGRTQLFLPSTSAILREVKCMGGITRHDAANVYHVLPAAHETASACWHCCEPIATGEAWVPLPRLFDPAENMFHVFGKTCCPGCAKAYILEHTTFDRGQHLNVLVKMLREVYGITGPVVETPPRPALRRFGGVFDPRAQQRAECRLVEPPFVSYCMIAEERMGMPTTELPRAPNTASGGGGGPSSMVEEAYDLDEPPPPGIFADFVKEMEESQPADEDASTSTATVSKRRREAAAARSAGAAASSGPLTKFVKQR